MASIHFVASGPGSAEPDAHVALSEERSYLAIVSSGSSRIRCIITGTTINAVALLSATASRVPSGSNLRRST